MAAERRRGGSAPAHCRRLGNLFTQLAPTGAASFSAFTDPSEELHPLFTGRPNLMLVPIATPLLASGDALDTPSLQRYVDHLYAAGCEGLQPVARGERRAAAAALAAAAAAAAAVRRLVVRSSGSMALAAAVPSV